MSVGTLSAIVTLVNGYPCRDCTDTENAKKGIDPAHPLDGPASTRRNLAASDVRGGIAPRVDLLV